MREGKTARTRAAIREHEAIRRGIREVVDAMAPDEGDPERERQFRGVPELRARLMQQYLATIEAVAAAARRPADPAAPPLAPRPVRR